MQNKIIICLLTVLIILNFFSLFLNKKSIKLNNKLITINNNNYENSINKEEKLFRKFSESISDNINNKLDNYLNSKDNTSKEEICLKNANSTDEIINCTKKVNEELQTEISEYLKLLKKDMPANEYKLITESQNAWEISANKDRKLIDKYVTEKDGTMYIPLSADYHKIITMNRAKFLTDIYYEYIDLAKGFCIILVVLFHCDIYFYHIGYEFNTMVGNTFRMPLYYFLSGLFFKPYNGFFNFAIRKANKLLIPFFFFYFCTGVIVPFILQELNVDMGIKSVIGWHSFIDFYNEKFTNIPLWFLLSLFETNIIFYFCLIFIEKYTKCFKIATLICILFIIGIIGFFMGRNNVNIQIFIDTSMTVLPFFAIGYIFRKYTHILEPNKWDKYWILFVLMSGGITYLLSGGNLMYIENKFDVHPIAFYVSGITGTLCVLFISKAIVKIPFISYIGRYSIMLLVTHLLLLAVVSLIINKIISNHDRAYWCTVCITLASYSIIIPLMKRFLPFVTAQKDLFKV